MDTLVFCFRRLDGTSSESFRQHYLTVHAPLAVRSVPTMAGYRVNYVAPDAPVAPGDGDELDGYDAVTIIDTPSAEAFFGGQAFGDPQAGARMAEDHRSFIGHMDAYQVAPAPALTVPSVPGEAVPGARLLLLCRDRELADPDRWPPVDLSGAEAVVHPVQRAWTSAAPPLAAVIELRGPDQAALVAAAGDLGDAALMLPVTEYIYLRVE